MIVIGASIFHNSFSSLHLFINTNSFLCIVFILFIVYEYISRTHKPELMVGAPVEGLVGLKTLFVTTISGWVYKYALPVDEAGVSTQMAEKPMEMWRKHANSEVCLFDDPPKVSSGQKFPQSKCPQVNGFDCLKIRGNFTLFLNPRVTKIA